MHINTYLGKTTTQRFWEKVRKRSSGCWEWQGFLSRGYGHIGISGKLYLVHRFSYWLHTKKLPKGNGWHGLCVCHTCDNRKCINPRHLFLATHDENMKDARKKGQFSLERNGRAKHTKKDIKKIREMYASGKYTQRQLGKIFGVSHTNIYAITTENTKRGLWK